MFNEQIFIDKYFKGNRESYNWYRKYRVRDTIHWEDIELQQKCLPENFQKSLGVIQTALGYLPAEHIYLPHLPFIQSYLGLHTIEISTVQSIPGELRNHLLNIRNDDIKKGGWLLTPKNTTADFNYYENHLSQFKEPANKRLAILLGFVPSIEYSLEAEIYLRKYFDNGFLLNSASLTNKDFKAATIALYKKVFVESGETVADKSCLFTETFSG